MAQPPAAVARTLKPVGQLQLHHLVERARFCCVRCRRDKTDSMVATMNGNWAQMVCGGCYGPLVHEYRERQRGRGERKVGRGERGAQTPTAGNRRLARILPRRWCRCRRSSAAGA